jgi:hypothetical protein
VHLAHIGRGTPAVSEFEYAVAGDRHAVGDGVPSAAALKKRNQKHERKTQITGGGGPFDCCAPTISCPRHEQTK